MTAILTDIEKINSLMTDMYQSFQALPLDAREFFYQKLTDDMVIPWKIYPRQAFS